MRLYRPMVGCECYVHTYSFFRACSRLNSLRGWKNQFCRLEPLATWLFFLGQQHSQAPTLSSPSAIWELKPTPKRVSSHIYIYIYTRSLINQLLRRDLKVSMRSGLVSKKKKAPNKIQWGEGPLGLFYNPKRNDQLQPKGRV